MVEAAAAGVKLMQEGGFFEGAQAGETFSLVRVVSGTSQVGVRTFWMVLAVLLVVGIARPRLLVLPD